MYVITCLLEGQDYKKAVWERADRKIWGAEEEDYVGWDARMEGEDGLTGHGLVS